MSFLCFRQPECYFMQNKKCIMHIKTCILCSSFTKKISGMDTPYQYISLISNRKLATRSLIISALSLLVAFCALILSFIKVISDVVCK